MEEEIDLRPYLMALFRRWPLILGLAAAVGVIVAVASYLSPRPITATASVLIVPATSQVALDPRFATRDATLLTNATFQRQALIGLATSTTLERRVAEQIATTAAPGTLLRQVDVSAEGDLMQVVASGATEAEALALAEAWASTYERLVAEVYSRDNAGLALIDEQLAQAQARYGEAQSQLEQFLGRSAGVQVEQQIVSIEGLLNGSSEAATNLYTEYLARIQELDLILSDARTLRAQVAEGDTDGLANRLAVLALSSRVADGTMPVELAITDGNALALDDQAALAELDGLVVVLEQQRDRLGRQAEATAEAIATGDTSAGVLSAAARERYEQELSALRSQLAQIQGEQQALEQSRSIALSSLEILQRKRDEQQIAETTPLINVRYISTSVDAAASMLIRFVLQTAVGLLAGALAGMALALWLEVGRPRLARLAGSPPADRPAEKPVAAP